MATKPKRVKTTEAIAKKNTDRKDGFGNYKPLAHQAEFHKNPSKYRAIVSGVGGGKTSMGVREAIKFSQKYPGSLGLIGRLTATSLRDTTQRRFFEICPPDLIYKWKETTGHLMLHTPVPGVYSEILFRHLDDAGPLGSLDIDWFWIDEAHEANGDEVPEDVFQMLQARLRGVVGPLRGWITTNSGGKDWIWRWFFSPSKSHECWGITVSSSANPYLPPGYVENLRKNNPEQWVNRFLEASFDVFEGQIFTEFIDKIEGRPAQSLEECYLCHVYDSEKIQITPGRTEAGFDFGISAPTAVVKGRIDQGPDGTIDIWITDEYYESEANIGTVANWIKSQGINFVYADPATVIRGASGESPQMLYAKEGVGLIPSPNDVATKIATIHQFLLKFRLHVSNKCTVTISQIQSYRWKPQPKNANQGTTEKPVKRDDHALDALGYLLMSVGIGVAQLDPLKPGARKGQDKVGSNGSWRHASLDEDTDREDGNYVTIADFLRQGGI